VTLSVVKTGTPASIASSDAFEYRLINPSKHHFEMPSVWQLVAGNLAANGDVHPEVAMKAAKDKTFDFHDKTRVVSIYHESGRLAGTFSFTMNGEAGMPISKHFADEISSIQQQLTLLNGWRFSMSPLYQSAALRLRSMTLYKQLVQLNGADAFVIYYNKRLEGYYRRIFNGHVEASKSISFDGSNELTVNMMVCKTSDNRPDYRYFHHEVAHEHALVI
jgi:hypothetical protein